MIDINKDILDFDENKKIQDIRINADVYIHYALINAQKTLLASTLKEGSIKDGILAYSVLIEQIETICVAAKYVEHKDVDTAVKEFEKDLDKKIESIYKMAKIANFKLEMLLKGILKRKAVTSPIKFGSELKYKLAKQLKDQVEEMVPEV